MSSVSVAVVGLGFGRNHVEALAGLGGRADLVAVVDPVAPADNPSLEGHPALAAMLAVPHYHSLTDLLAVQVPDIVAIATPIHTHLALGREALAAGANVLLEKPPTATLEEYRELVAASEASGKAVQIGFQARGGGGVTAVRDAVGCGLIGEVTGIGVVGTWLRSRAYFDRAAWAGRRTLNGVTVMDGVVTNPLAHSIDVALTLAGAFTEQDVTSVQIDPWHANDIESDDTTSVIITTANGTTIAAGLTLCSASEKQPVVTVRGTLGELRLQYKLDVVEHVAADGTSTITQYGTEGMLENLVDHVAEGVDLIVPVERTGAFMRVLEAARTGAAPRLIDPAYGTWVGEGDQVHPVLDGVDDWCAKFAETGKSFTELGAPWTR